MRKSRWLRLSKKDRVKVLGKDHEGEEVRSIEDRVVLAHGRDSGTGNSVRGEESPRGKTLNEVKNVKRI